MTSRSIIVGVDLSEPSVTAARWTTTHLGASADVVLVHAIDVREPPSFLRGLYPATDQLIDNARRGAETRLRELTTSLKARVYGEVRVGRADAVLTSVAAETRAELIVVGLHGERSGIWKVLGSTAERVARRAPTSVLLGRQLPSDGPQRVLVAIDDSPTTRKVIEWGARLAGAGGENAFVMHVANPLTTARLNKGDRQRAETEARRLTEQWMRAQIAGTALESATVCADFGDPGFQILATIDRENADILVIGRKSSADGGGFLGSVAEFLLRNGKGPVLIAVA